MDCIINYLLYNDYFRIFRQFTHENIFSDLSWVKLYQLIMEPKFDPYGLPQEVISQTHALVGMIGKLYSKLFKSYERFLIHLCSLDS